MHTLSSGLLKVALCAIACLALDFPFETLAQPPRASSAAQLTTAAERADFCTQMREAATPAERQAIAQKWHETMIARAAEQGVELPPGMRDHQPMMGDGSGMHMGMGMNCGPGAAGTGKSSSSGAAGLPVAQNRGIAYVTGGVGQDEVAAMRSVASGYSMRARFSTSTGEFVSGVSVRLSQADGKLIFAATSDGPYLYAQVPPGHYRLSATLNGVERSRRVDIPPRGGVNVAMMWPAERPGSGG
ncbi:hypothetical protein B0G71_4665 [Paraburkholderia sp. BL27I4N3]|uniref:carboxypeptidase-like regulatory domain-containing protein n=1 Tax=Paraburkholderia sp. BL27I4N3 TaxID=1938805 RepID=UPI000E3B3FED|nr:carboxypeptidase-like regulatory domain-containing protein [Paraburkholderia sp. BL27I4N3]REE21490.1 hypothetical protein B0G71_4665 [Paraburkholderia sp. BL27I4N3]